MNISKIEVLALRSGGYVVKEYADHNDGSGDVLGMDAYRTDEELILYFCRTFKMDRCAVCRRLQFGKGETDESR